MQVTQQIIRLGGRRRQRIGCAGHTFTSAFCDRFDHALDHRQAQSIDIQRIERRSTPVLGVKATRDGGEIPMVVSGARRERRKVGALLKARHNPTHRAPHGVARVRADDRPQHRQPPWDPRQRGCCAPRRPDQSRTHSSCRARCDSSKSFGQLRLIDMPRHRRIKLAGTPASIAS